MTALISSLQVRVDGPVTPSWGNPRCPVKGEHQEISAFLVRHKSAEVNA